MPRYSLESKHGFTHVLHTYSESDNFVYVQLYRDGKPFDYSLCTAVRFRVGKSFKKTMMRCDCDKASEGLLGISLKGALPGGYCVPISLDIPDEGTICFGKATIFVDSFTFGSDIPKFSYDPEYDLTDAEEAVALLQFDHDGKLIPVFVDAFRKKQEPDDVHAVFVHVPEHGHHDEHKEEKKLNINISTVYYKQ